MAPTSQSRAHNEGKEEQPRPGRWTTRADEGTEAGGSTGRPRLHRGVDASVDGKKHRRRLRNVDATNARRAALTQRARSLFVDDSVAVIVGAVTFFRSWHGHTFTSAPASSPAGLDADGTDPV